MDITAGTAPIAAIGIAAQHYRRLHQKNNLHRGYRNAAGHCGRRELGVHRRAISGVRGGTVNLSSDRLLLQRLGGKRER